MRQAAAAALDAVGTVAAVDAAAAGDDRHVRAVMRLHWQAVQSLELVIDRARAGNEDAAEIGDAFDAEVAEEADDDAEFEVVDLDVEAAAGIADGAEAVSQAERVDDEAKRSEVVDKEWREATSQVNTKNYITNNQLTAACCGTAPPVPPSLKGKRLD